MKLTQEENMTLDMIIDSMNDSLNDILSQDPDNDLAALKQREYSLMRKLRAIAAEAQGERQPSLWTVTHEDAGYYHSEKKARQAAQDFDAEVVAFIRA